LIKPALTWTSIKLAQKYWSVGDGTEHRPRRANALDVDQIEEL